MKKKAIHFLVVFLISSFIDSIPATGQTVPSVGTPLNDTVYLNTGANFILLPDVKDNDPGIEQDFIFSVGSSDESILEITSTEYTPGQGFAVIRVLEKGKAGVVSVTIEASDGDGTATTACDVTVTGYNRQGINFEIHDLVFWQQNVPLDATPAFSMISSSGEAPYSSIDLASLNLSVYSDCQESPPCTGTDFFTGFFRGYVVPPTSGTYRFLTRSNDQCNLGLSTDHNFSNANVLIHSSNNVGTLTGGIQNERISADVQLTAGKVYAIYSAKWEIHSPLGGILWEGPGITREYIPGEYLAYVYDNTKPSKPSGLSLIFTGTDDLMVRWNKSTDDKGLASYIIYANGTRINPENTLETIYTVTGLESETTYSIAVTAIDEAGNESDLSGIITTKTYGEDLINPLPPETVGTSMISDIAVKLTWSGASDNETEIRGYYVYMNDVLINTSDLVYDEFLVVTGLTPRTTYNAEIEAVDAAGNVSERSTPFEIVTADFDPADIRFGTNKGRMKVEFTPIGRNAGVGVNVDYASGDFNNDEYQMDLLKDLQPAAIRWGAITANSLNFSDYIGTGNSHGITFAEFMSICNELDAYTIITCGVENSTDWMTEPETFTRFLEYLGGPSSSEYGAIRAAEGYADPLLSACKGLIFEFGNEVWGAAAHDAQIGSSYVAYRAWAREMALLMRNSPYYDENRIFLVYSGRHPHPDESYGLNRTVLQGDTGEVDWLALSGYLGGNFSPEIETGDTELGYFKNGIAKMKFEIQGLELTMEHMVELTGSIMPSYFYESNMTSNTFYGRLGQAVIQTDYYMEAVEHGGALPTIFHFTGGQWKMVVPGQDYKRLALYEAARLINRHCKGNALKTSVESMAEVTDSDGEYVDLEPVGCHAYTNDGDFGLLLVSRDFRRDYTVQIDLPDDFSFEPEGKIYVLSGDHYSSNEFTLDSAAIEVSDSMLVDVPKFSLVVISFKGEDLQFETLPLGFYDYKRATGVTIKSKNDSGFEISGIRESKTFVAEFEPQDAFIKIANWEIATNDVNVKYSIAGNEIRITSTGTCSGNGTISIKASAKDNPLVSDEANITISNQGTDCGSGIDPMKHKTLWSIYPNPCKEGMITLTCQGADIKTKITIRDLTGRIIDQYLLEGNPERIDSSNWGKGIYLISLEKDSHAEYHRVLIM